MNTALSFLLSFSFFRTEYVFAGDCLTTRNYPGVLPGIYQVDDDKDVAVRNPCPVSTGFCGGFRVIGVAATISNQRIEGIGSAGTIVRISSTNLWLFNLSKSSSN